MSADPDEVIDHVPTGCGGCGADLADFDGRLAAGATSAGYARRQVHDLPERIAAQVTEHRVHRLRCGCGHTITAPAPADAPATVPYGPRLVAFLASLVVV